MAEETETPSSSDRPTSAAKNFATRLNAVKGLIVAITALVVALIGVLKPTDNSATKVTYDTLAQELKALSEQTAKHHDDLMALRGYVDGYIKAQQDEPPVSISAPTAGPAAGHPAKPTVITVTARPKAAAPPKLSAKPAPWAPAPFEQMLAQVPPPPPPMVAPAAAYEMAAPPAAPAAVAPAASK